MTIKKVWGPQALIGGKRRKELSSEARRDNVNNCKNSLQGQQGRDNRSAELNPSSKAETSVMELDDVLF